MMSIFIFHQFQQIDFPARGANCWSVVEKWLVFERIESFSLRKQWRTVRVKGSKFLRFGGKRNAIDDEILASLHFESTESCFPASHSVAKITIQHAL